MKIINQPQDQKKLTYAEIPVGMIFTWSGQQFLKLKPRGYDSCFGFENDTMTYFEDNSSLNFKLHPNATLDLVD